tara:strand:- start:114 stop:290 length:177 start_codon:yes stop_codon:yes gene_type:complete
MGIIYVRQKFTTPVIKIGFSWWRRIEVDEILEKLGRLDRKKGWTQICELFPRTMTEVD